MYLPLKAASTLGGALGFMPVYDAGEHSEYPPPHWPELMGIKWCLLCNLGEVRGEKLMAECCCLLATFAGTTNLMWHQAPLAWLLRGKGTRQDFHPYLQVPATCKGLPPAMFLHLSIARCTGLKPETFFWRGGAIFLVGERRA